MCRPIAWSIWHPLGAPLLTTDRRRGSGLRAGGRASYMRMEDSVSLERRQARAGWPDALGGIGEVRGVVTEGTGGGRAGGPGRPAGGGAEHGRGGGFGGTVLGGDALEDRPGRMRQPANSKKTKAKARTPKLCNC